MMVPALLSAAEQQGFRAWRGIGGEGAVVDLGNGIYVNWQQSMNHQDFELHVTLPGGIPEGEVEGRVASTKAQADQIWAAAAELRRAAPVSTVVIQGAPPPPPPPGMTVSLGVPGANLTLSAPSGGECRYGTDGVQACGYACRIGTNGRARCAATPDGTCEMNTDGSVSCGRNCQFTASGIHVCQ
jgi:hypothetical protein